MGTVEEILLESYDFEFIEKFSKRHRIPEGKGIKNLLATFLIEIRSDDKIKKWFKAIKTIFSASYIKSG